jgi:hypothetical protein
MAAATTSATRGSSGVPASIVRFTERKTSLGNCAFMVASPKTLVPNSDAAGLSL